MFSPRVVFRLRKSLLVPALLPLLFAAGCASKGTVTGSVTYKGQTVGSGMVTFVLVGGKEGAGTGVPIGADGTYHASNLAPGAYKVGVMTSPPQKAPTFGGKTIDMPNAPGGEVAAGKYVAIPAKYGGPDSSGLTTTVKGGSQTYNIEMQ
jgi:hypothetical protein